jgi:hypothetical protein
VNQWIKEAPISATASLKAKPITTGMAFDWSGALGSKFECLGESAISVRIIPADRDPPTNYVSENAAQMAPERAWEG